MAIRGNKIKSEKSSDMLNMRLTLRVWGGGNFLKGIQPNIRLLFNGTILYW